MGDEESVGTGPAYTFTGFSPKAFTIGQMAQVMITGTGFTNNLTVTLQESVVPGLTWSPSTPFSPPTGVPCKGGTMLGYLSTPSLAGHMDETGDGTLQGTLLVTVWDDSGMIQPVTPISSGVLYYTKPILADDEG